MVQSTSQQFAASPPQADSGATFSMTFLSCLVKVYG